MSRDLVADAILHCHVGASRLVAARSARGDLIVLAKRAAGYNASAERFQRQVPAAKAAAEAQWDVYEDHVAECDECHERVSA